MDRLALEVVAEAEIAQHLEERVMARRVADVLEIVVLAARAHAALRARRTVNSRAMSLPRNTSLNCTMPALVNSSVGSLPGTSELEGTTAWPFLRKNSRKLARISELVIILSLASRFISRLSCLHPSRYQSQRRPESGAGEAPVSQKSRLALPISVIGRQRSSKLLLPRPLELRDPVRVGVAG